MHALAGLVLLALAAALAGCDRGPDQAHLAEDLQERLDRSFSAGLLELNWLRRAGSAPEAGDSDAEAAAIVYFDAEIALRRDYDFTAWDSPGVAALADLLGASQEGLRGIAQGGNAAGDRIQVHGSMRYRLSDGVWQPRPYLGAAPTAPAPFDNVSPPSRAVTLLEQIEALLRSAEIDALGPEGAIVTYELESAWTNIQRRLDRVRSVYGFASGPPDGEYWRLARAYGRFMAGRGLQVANLRTSGSVENARLLRRDEADLAIMQSDVAVLALRGEGPFVREGPAEDLRALASLYPEPVHVVVMANSGITSIAELAGRSVDLGPLGSGTRNNAWAILRAHGLTPSDLEGFMSQPLRQSLAALARGEIAAVFSTIGVPAQSIRDFLALHDARLIGLDSRAVEQIVMETPGLLAFTIPAYSYLGQSAPVPTVSATALLVTQRRMPEGEAVALLTATFEQMNFLELGSFQGTRISRARAKEAIGLPLHPGAEAYFAGESPQPQPPPQQPLAAPPPGSEGGE